MREQVPAPPGQQTRAALFGILAVAVTIYLALELGTFLKTGRWLPGFPPTVLADHVFGLIRQQEPWLPEYTVSSAVVGVLALVLLFLGMSWRTSLRKRKQGLTRAARSLSQGTELSLAEVERRSAAGRLTTGDVKGIMLVRTMDTNQPRYTDARKTGVVVMGPESGKTTGLAIPMILDAPGVVLATSNKRDLPDAIRGSRKGRVWVFDPQQITGRTPPPWWLNLAGYITDEIRAHKLAKIWMDASGPANAKRDAYFDSAGPNLLAGLLLACAIARKPISQVFLWLTSPADQRPIKILSEAGYTLPAASLEGVYFAPDKQRAGVFGTAAEMVSFLNNSRVRAWVESTGPSDPRPVFSPEAFVRSRDETLIALSKEGIGSTGPLTAALSVWVLDAAEEYADTNPHGRLPIPMMAILDEAANVCRIKDLPDLTSHYGSRGICLWPFLQSWSQGCRAWTEEGMMQLWSAANIRIIGAGQSDTKFLETVSKLLGKHQVPEYSTNSSSKGNGGYSRTVTQREKPIMDVDDIAALIHGQCIVHHSGGRAFLANLVPWFDRPQMADYVARSIEKYEPS